jgi:hypothetical protein
MSNKKYILLLISLKKVQMRVIFLLLILFSFHAIAQTDSLQDEKEIPGKWHEVDRNYEVGPWKEYSLPFMSMGMLGKINDSLLADLGEISINNWLCYMYYSNPFEFPYIRDWGRISEEEKQRLYSVQPDSGRFPSDEFINSLDDKTIFKKCKHCAVIRHGIELDYYLPVEADSIKTRESKDRLIKTLSLPIAGITYEQALSFCSWRTQVDSIRFRRQYNFRLPTPFEFDLINPFQDSVLTGKHARSLFNYKDAFYPVGKSRYLKEFEFCGKKPLRCYTFCTHLKNKTIHQFFFNVRGNLAEMTSIKGVATGGSYVHPARESFATINNPYSQPELWLGFRCFAERKKIKPPGPTQ